jgi:hypothetical protein
VTDVLAPALKMLSSNWEKVTGINSITMHAPVVRFAMNNVPVMPLK